MTAVIVEINGCDDYTKFLIEGTPDQIAWLKSIAAKSEEASRYGCMPILVVGEAGHEAVV